MHNKSKKLFIRDLSWLSFNERVMQEAQDVKNTLHDRLKFLGIFSNNQDEFFRVRVAALTRMKKYGNASKMHLEENPASILKQVNKKVNQQAKIFDKTYNEIITEMAEDDIFIKNEKQLTALQKEFVSQYFNEKVRTHIVPLMIESIPKMPYLRDKSIYLACLLGNTDHPLIHRYALIEIPTKNISRFITLPTENNEVHFILLEDIIRYNLPAIFAPFGFNRFLGYIIKVTRDAEFDIDNDEQTNVVINLEKAIKSRKKGNPTRLVYDRNIDTNLLEFLRKKLFISDQNTLIAGGRIHNFKDFMNFPSEPFSFEKKSKRTSLSHPQIVQPCRIMSVLDDEDILLHFPYHKFDPIIDLLREAAIDPFVESIKITCYRLAKNSKIINALLNAVRNGKKVTAVLELRARFEEEANLGWKEKLEEEGVQVLLGIPEMKIHAKICVIKKREFNKTKYYGFISTGNFNEQTARFYGDHCLMTSDTKLLNDVNRIFNYIQKPTKDFDLIKKCKHLLVSPYNTRSTFLSLIDKEIKNHQKGRPASISIKLNSLVDPQLIYKLYEAAKAGVKVRLIIRGINCALPEQKQLKSNLSAISIVDEYLEHARIMIFENHGEPLVFISSADWMIRNIDHRIEATTPIYNKELAKELIDIFDIQWSDNVKARLFDNKQINEYLQPEDNNAKIIRSQEKIALYLQTKN